MQYLEKGFVKEFYSLEDIVCLTVVFHEAETCADLFLCIEAEFAAEFNIIRGAVWVDFNFVVAFCVCGWCFFY